MQTVKIYTRTIRGQEYSFTAYRAKAEAKCSIHVAHSPCLVEIKLDGQTYYDAYPLGHPIPADATIIERATGGRWESINERLGKKGLRR